MYDLYNLVLGPLVEEIPDLDTAYWEFSEFVAVHGDLPSDTVILDSVTGEVVAIVSREDSHQPVTIELDDSVPGMIVEPKKLPEREVPEDFDI